MHKIKPAGVIPPVLLWPPHMPEQHQYLKWNFALPPMLLLVATKKSDIQAAWAKGDSRCIVREQQTGR
jgi:hypothetical protein